MPVYNFRCQKCGFTREKLVASDKTDLLIGADACPECGLALCRVFTPTTNTIFPGYMKEENNVGRARQRAYIESPECKKRRDAGLADVVPHGD